MCPNCVKNTIVFVILCSLKIISRRRIIRYIYKLSNDTSSKEFGTNHIISTESMTTKCMLLKDESWSGAGSLSTWMDEFLCMVTGSALGTDVQYVIGWLNKSQHGSRSTRFPFKGLSMMFHLRHF